jgi:hypothetical protein
MLRGGQPAGVSPVIAPPGPPAPGTAEALFAQARRRRRRRRLTGVVVILALALSAAVAFAATRPDRARAGRDAGGARAGSGGAAGPAGWVAWVDYNRRVHLGDLATAAQRVVATINANPAVPLVQAGGHLYFVGGYWVNQAGTYVPASGNAPPVVQELNLATGTIRDVGPGQGVFPSSDGRHLFLAPTDTRLLELPARGSGTARALRLPRGWYLPYGGQGYGVAEGVLVQPDRTTRPRTPLAVWNPTTGGLKVIGAGLSVLAAYTAPGGHDSLLAWQPVACAGQNCPLKITNTATLATRTVHSPLRHGFAPGAAFSPHGTQLAVFASTTPDTTGPVATTGPVRLALVTTSTGAVRLSGSARLAGGCPPAWAAWLPDGRHLITGGIQASYVVTAATLSARPLFFMPGTDHDIENSQDINYSAAIVPLRR